MNIYTILYAKRNKLQPYEGYFKTGFEAPVFKNLGVYKIRYRRPATG
jgi:hypothetical protein